jgi:hypothetical protein
MRPFPAVILCLALGVAACRSTSYDQAGPVGVRNMWASEHIREASLRQAILTQSTLHPYHFVVGAAELNELGWRDMEVLAAHFVAHGGTLSVRRGGVDEELYGARLKRVETALAAVGVEPGRVRVTDTLPGGNGITSERMLEVLEKASKELQTQDASTGATSTSATGSTSAGN